MRRQRILRAHGLCDKVIQEMFRSLVLARLSYAYPAWWGFAGSKDRQIIYGFLRRCIRSDFCSTNIYLHYTTYMYVPRRIVICFIKYSHLISHAPLAPFCFIHFTDDSVTRWSKQLVPWRDSLVFSFKWCRHPRRAETRVSGWCRRLWAALGVVIVLSRFYKSRNREGESFNSRV